MNSHIIFFYKNGPTSEHIYDEAFYRFNSFILKKNHEKYETIKKIKEGIIRKQNPVNLGKKYSLKFQSMEF
jgi:hypothetical protein